MNNAQQLLFAVVKDDHLAVRGPADITFPGRRSQPVHRPLFAAEPCLGKKSPGGVRKRHRFKGGSLAGTQDDPCYTFIQFNLLHTRTPSVLILNYPFTAPAVSPVMNCFCMHRYRITIGNDARITLANTRFHLEVRAPIEL